MTIAIKQQFPALNQQHLTYLDSAATTHKPDVVLDAMHQFQSFGYATSHRGSYYTALQTTRLIEHIREQVAGFVGATADQLIWVPSASYAANLLAQSILETAYSGQQVLHGDTVLISISEHHANYLPWVRLAQKLQLKVKFLPVGAQGESIDWLPWLDSSTALLAVSHVSNVLGNINPVQQLCERARAVNCLSVVDGTQAMPHIDVNMAGVAADAYFFSGHKMYGPTGVGGLVLRPELIEQLHPAWLAGEMVAAVDGVDFCVKSGAAKFELGTLPLTEIIGLGATVDWLTQHRAGIRQRESEVTAYARERLRAVPSIRLFGDQNSPIGIYSFTISGIDSFDIGTGLAAEQIACRVGQHCAMPLIRALGEFSCIRWSLGCYTEKTDIDHAIDALQRVISLTMDPQSGATNATLSAPADKGGQVKGQHPVVGQRTSASNGDCLAQIKNARSWNAKHRLLLILSRHLSEFGEVDRCTAELVAGCEHRLWLQTAEPSVARIPVIADSESKIIRGILVMICEYIERQLHSKRSIGTQSEHAFWSTAAFWSLMDDSGLTPFLSAGRVDGLGMLFQRLSELLERQRSAQQGHTDV